MAKEYNIWWGPPKKFSANFEERKISWLELFYDLVYVVVISKVTYQLALNHSWTGVLDYAYLFAMVFWGWYNGSQYHDLHGSPGIRTRFMTLWQMVAVGALAVMLNGSGEHLISRATIGILVLQLFITYLWWSVGIYDKHHRKLNRPYTYCFLAAFALLCISGVVPFSYRRMLLWTVLVLNYFPFLLTALRLRNTSNEFSMSPSMTERLGLFTIIVFGEAILGVINSMTSLSEISASLWICFGMGILIVFALWWIFFSLIADRVCKPGILEGFVLSFLFIPTLASLGMVGAAFPSLIQGFTAPPDAHRLQLIYGISISVFLCSIVAISRFLVYAEEYQRSKKRVQYLLLSMAVINLVLVFFFGVLSALVYLLCVFLILMSLIVILTKMWFRLELDKLNKETD